MPATLNLNAFSLELSVVKVALTEALNYPLSLSSEAPRALFHFCDTSRCKSSCLVFCYRTPIKVFPLLLLLLLLPPPPSRRIPTAAAAAIATTNATIRIASTVPPYALVCPLTRFALTRFAGILNLA